MRTEYKLKYEDKQSAITDLKDRGCLIETEDGDIYAEHIRGIVHVYGSGKIVDVKATYDEDDNMLTPTTFIEGYHVDVYSMRDDLEFSGVRQFPKNPRHRVKGWGENEEIIIK